MLLIRTHSNRCSLLARRRFNCCLHSQVGAVGADIKCMKLSLFTLFLALLLTALLPAKSAANDDLQRYLPPEQVRWLTVADENETNTRYLALYKEPMVNFARGQMVSMPDWHLHPLQSNLIQASYQHSPELGWHSWALVPPALALDRSQLTTARPDSVFPAVVDDTFFVPFRDALKKRLQRLTTEFDDEPGFTVWVLEGVTAAIAVQLISAEPALMPDALVVVDLYLPQVQLNKALSRQLAQLQLPVLEIISSNSNRWVTDAQSFRREYSQKYQQINYRQRALLSDAQLAQAELRSTVKGWLKYHGF